MPGFTVFALLHRLRKTRLPTTGNHALATRDHRGAMKLAVWNLIPPTIKQPIDRRVKVHLLGIKPGRTARVITLDDNHGNSLAAYRAMGSPRYPTSNQIFARYRVAAIPPAQSIPIDRRGNIELTLTPNAIMLIDIPAQ